MTTSNAKVLVVDDEENMCEVLRYILEKENYEVLTATDGIKALETFRENNFDVVIQDIKMPGMDGLSLIKEYQQINPSTLVTVITAFSTFQTAVEAIRLGAYDYIKKPFDNLAIKSTIQRAIQARRVLTNSKDFPFQIMIGATPQMKEVYSLIQRVARTDSTVLIQGESGTGKELVARALHFSSARANEPFIAVNCGGFPETLLESELFGHLKGSFTSAIADKKGLLEVAEGGTFFLDEVSELSPQLQVKLLRVLEEKEFKPVGSTETKKVDIRFITATNADLASKVKAKTFREDLYYRLNVISINLPPLRERKDDIPLLAGHFLAKYSQTTNKKVEKFSSEALELLINYDWPGNVRELENTIHRAVVLSDGLVIKPDVLVSKVRAAWPTPTEESLTTPDRGIDLEAKIRTIEEDYIRQALKITSGKITKAAKLLNLDSRALRYKIKKYQIKPMTK